MASHGIKDQVAIVGMGCTRFGEHWDKSADDLLVDASEEAFASAGVAKDDVDAYWLGTAMSGMSGMALARPLRPVRDALDPSYGVRAVACAARAARAGAIVSRSWRHRAQRGPVGCSSPRRAPCGGGLP